MSRFNTNALDALAPHEFPDIRTTSVSCTQYSLPLTHASLPPPFLIMRAHTLIIVGLVVLVGLTTVQVSGSKDPKKSLAEMRKNIEAVNKEMEEKRKAEEIKKKMSVQNLTNKD
ncbi:hypothetical protein IWQ60_009767 [Tieghemiomyces parasiticus]|uniref:Uncharacterized protein n=1 Tax=Tieghemiomyces parasiticus TaxID=78921 RepID=A0A9W7ZV37_9FUNG|nr:hypothetical protein IWQ60_009767 [Tieghemiomyces parasiticus]